jgi:small subunit ribosomal protein S4
MHGRRRSYRRKTSDYGLQLREKQKLRRIYGVLERQFRRYYADAAKYKGLTGANLLSLLETRLDNIVYRLGFAASRDQARQLVLHGHFEVNGQRAKTPSMLLSANDVISVRERSRKLAYFRDVRKALENVTTPEWLTLDDANLQGTVMSLPTREQLDIPVKEQLVVEYYSR